MSTHHLFDIEDSVDQQESSQLNQEPNDMRRTNTTDSTNSFVAYGGAQQYAIASGNHGVTYIQTPVLDPMAASSAFADDYWRETLSMQAMWSLKLIFLLFLGSSLCLFGLARGDPLAVQLVACISALCILFYNIRIQNRAAHADRVALTAACAWIVYSASTAFSGRILDQTPTVFMMRDLGLIFCACLIGLRYWVMMHLPHQVQSMEYLFVRNMFRVWTAESPWVVFVTADIDPREYQYSRNNSGNPYATKPSDSQYLGAAQRLIASAKWTASSNADPAAKNDPSRRSLDSSDLLYRILGSIVSLTHEIFYWAFAIGCALPLHNNCLFVESPGLTVLRVSLFVIIYMISDSLLDPPTRVAALHVAPTLLVTTIYVLFVSPLFLVMISVFHLCVLGTAVVLHARDGSMPWSRWACIELIQKRYFSRNMSEEVLDHPDAGSLINGTNELDNNDNNPTESVEIVHNIEDSFLGQSPNS